ncbi:aliphatic sulfonate ABC transporter substrate-binding protein [Arthrobacter ginkgonis]|uniref:Aliphatic sulfonate ABC transporter substrate-binding protein n=1 Tax=Arthrobacter ginkgonis TaxID=1630594 RepID=A0ABP7CF39_9MICC
MTDKPQKPESIRIDAAAPAPHRRKVPRLAAALVALLAVAALATAWLATTGLPAPSGAQAAAGAGPADKLRLGYFANVTHAPAVVGVEQGRLADAVGRHGTTLETQVFNAGPAAIEALNAGAIDAAFLGPSPAINSYIKSGGTSLRVIAGAASGGAQFVVDPSITKPADLNGAVLASPQLGGTQDVALRTWLADQGLKTTPDGGGEVAINPTGNAETLDLFRSGKLDGAWLPEPWSSRLVLEADAKVLVDEADLWDGGEFPTTILVVDQRFAAAHPETVADLLAGHRDTVAWLDSADTATRLDAVGKGLTSLGAALPEDVLARALGNLTFTTDPLAGTYPTLMEHAVEAGLTESGQLEGLVDTTVLDALPADAADGTGK